MELVSVDKDGLSPKDEMFNRLIRRTFKENYIESFHLFLTQSWTLIDRRLRVYMATTVCQI